MTRISQNGQLEFIFDELDFLGAFNEVKESIKVLIKVRNLLHDQSLKYLRFDPVKSESIKLSIDIISSEIDKYFDVMGHLEALSKGGNM